MYEDCNLQIGVVFVKECLVLFTVNAAMFFAGEIKFRVVKSRIATAKAAFNKKRALFY
jgi:hypothetical protein